MIWRIITGLFVIVAGMTGIIKFDDRYAKCDDTEQCFKDVELTIVQTFEKFQDTQDMRQSDMMYDSYERDYNNCKRDMKANPNNPDLAEECADIKKEKDRMWKKKKALMGG